jgi:2-polyprenyl-6-methoxyphenol hydroxylase-like FAD-dependent oxidoreductase
VALLGDAGYAVSLLAGQGAALAIAGAYVLGEQLARAASTGAALAGYEQALRPIVADRQKTARSTARWFVPATRWQLRLRHAAVALTGLPFADRIAAATLIGKPAALIADAGRAERLVA